MKNYKTLIYDPSTATPIGVRGDNVYILGSARVDEDDPAYEEDDDEVVISIPVSTFIANLEAWLDAKQDYCERYGDHFCGENGYIYCETFTEKSIDHISAKYHTAYQAEVWDEPDMEHG